jgi:hypothetical protein
MCTNVYKCVQMCTNVYSYDSAPLSACNDIDIELIYLLNPSWNVFTLKTEATDRPKPNGGVEASVHM